MGRVRSVAVLGLLLMPPITYLYMLPHAIHQTGFPLQNPWILWIPPYLVATICIFPLRARLAWLGAIALLVFGSVMLLHVFGAARWR